jgi:hypothetical protein
MVPRWLQAVFSRMPNNPQPGSEGPTARALHYPWFTTVDGDDLEQGDIFEDCPVFFPPSDLVPTTAGPTTTKFTWTSQDLVVMTQSCDLAKTREKVEDVLLCAVWRRSELPGPMQKDERMEEARKGRMPAFHVLAASDLPGFEREVRLVDFRRIHSLPLSFLREKAKASRRLRLLPPYREHLSQSFARLFMRVGLPIDIPPFTSKPI